MARPRTINRELLLDHAEHIVSDQGAARLTFGSLATASSVPKASIQSAFGTREKLLDGLIERWARYENERYQSALGADHSPENRLKAHLTTTAAETADAGNRLATTLAAMVGSGSHSESITAWYKDRLGSLDASTPAERKQRIAYLAAEGALYIRNMAKLEMSDALWRDIFADLEELALDL